MIVLKIQIIKSKKQKSEWGKPLAFDYILAFKVSVKHYQILTRFSGAIYIASPSFTSNAL